MRSPFVLPPLLAGLALACGAPSAPGAQSPERQAEAEYDVARDLLHKGDLRTALEHSKKANDLDPDNVPALYCTATIYLSFCTSIRSTSISPSTTVSSDCKLDQAEKYARAALEKDARFRDARNALGTVLILEGKNQEAVGILKPLVNDPGYESIHYAWANLGWAQVRSGAVDDGISSLKNATTAPKFCIAYYRLGVAYAKKGDLTSAESNLTSAIQVESPECQALQEAWLERGLVRMKQGKSSEGCADLGRCRELDADSEVGKQCVDMLKKCG